MAQSKNQEIQNKFKVLKYAESIKKVSEACRYYGISRETYYEWHRKYQGKEKLV